MHRARPKYAKGPCGGANRESENTNVDWDASGDGELPPDCQVFKGVDDLDACLDAALECERLLARRAYWLRKLILNLQIRRDHGVELGRRIGA